jgi:hypothetical protein
MRARRRLPTAASAIAVVAVLGLAGALAVWLAVRDPGDGAAAADVIDGEEPTTTTTVPCLPLHADYDGDPGNGCEAAPFGPDDGTELGSDEPVEANLVPEDDRDTYTVAVIDEFQVFCDGTLEITLTAPPEVGQKVEVFDGEELLGEAGSLDGQPGTVEIEEPSCGGDDTTELEVVVSTVAGRTADRYVLERSGSF